MGTAALGSHSRPTADRPQRAAQGGHGDSSSAKAERGRQSCRAWETELQRVGGRSDMQWFGERKNCRVMKEKEHVTE